jgi:hypothetical protein
MALGSPHHARPSATHPENAGARTCSGSTIRGFEPKWAATGERYLPAWPSRENAPMTRDPMKWDGKVYRQVRFGDDGSIKGTAKEAEIKMRRKCARRRDAAADARALAEVEAARYARLPWPIRAVGVILDIVFRRPSP